MNDEVNSPAHYAAGGLEPIEIMEAKMSDEEFMGFLQGNALKYLLRYKHKGMPLTDLKKARYYLDKMIVQVEKDLVGKFDHPENTSPG